VTCPNLSGSYVDLTSDQTIGGNKTFTGTVSVNGTLSGPGTFSWQVATSSQTAIPNRGYIADSTDPVTITLPTNPNIGDVIRINGLGTGGWRVMPGSGQLIVTSLTALPPYYQKDGLGERTPETGGALPLRQMGQSW
jgi:hypothetical protein